MNRMNIKGEVCTVLLGINWVTNGSYLHRQISYKSNIGGSDYMAQKSARKGVINDVDKKYVTFGNSSGETTRKTTRKTTQKTIQKTTQKTTQKASHNIRVNNLHANCFQIARKNQHLQLIVRGNRETEPQINADERRFVDRDFQQNSTRMTRMTRIKRIFTDTNFQYCDSLRYESMLINNGFSLEGV